MRCHSKFVGDIREEFLDSDVLAHQENLKPLGVAVNLVNLRSEIGGEVLRDIGGSVDRSETFDFYFSKLETIKDGGMLHEVNWDFKHAAEPSLELLPEVSESYQVARLTKTKSSTGFKSDSK